MFTKMKYPALVLILLFALTEKSDAGDCCGGGTGELLVLSLYGIGLVNTGIVYDRYLGVWDKDGKWRPYEYDITQTKILLNGAYRISRRFQFAISLPVIYNSSSVPRLKNSSWGVGDFIVGGRFEIFHEFQPKKTGKKLILDHTLPYTAITFGLLFPTGRSEETAENDVDIMGKGFYTTSLGLALTKSIIRSKLQVLADASWQHSFEKNYDSYYNVPLNSEFRKQPGDKFSYSLGLNYMFNMSHEVSITASGFVQGDYTVNDKEGYESDERSNNLLVSYTYYPTTDFRITTNFRAWIPRDDYGKNALGSNTFNINFRYYFSDLK
jgi:hypothetical protein